MLVVVALVPNYSILDRNISVTCSVGQGMLVLPSHIIPRSDPKLVLDTTEPVPLLTVPELRLGSSLTGDPVYQESSMSVS